MSSIKLLLLPIVEFNTTVLHPVSMPQKYNHFQLFYLLNEFTNHCNLTMVKNLPVLAAANQKANRKGTQFNICKQASKYALTHEP